MSPTGPSGNPFEGLPFFGDLAKLLGRGGGIPWDAARSLALAVATEGQSEANVDPVERMTLEQLGRVAELHVAKVTGLSTDVAGRELTIMPVNRALWATKTLAAFRPLLERLAASLGSPPPAGPGTPGAPGAPGAEQHPSAADATPPNELDQFGDDLGDDQLGAMLGPMLQAMQPTMVAMTAGSMVGHLARRSFGSYDLPVPRPPSDELMIVVPNLTAFGEEWSLPPDDLRLWICLHQITHHAVLGVPHVRARLDDLLDRFATGFRNDPRALEEHLRNIEGGSDPDDLLGQLQQMLGEPGALLGAIQSDEQRALQPQLEDIVALVVGVVDYVMDKVGAKLIPSYGMLTEALRRRRVETSESDRFVERMLGLELTQRTYERGSHFVDGVVERAGDEGLVRLWESERLLPTRPEMEAPGLWLARSEYED